MTDAANPALTADQQRELQQSRDLLAAVWGDPSLRAGVRKHLKDKFPDRRLPDDDFEAISAPLRADIDNLKKQNQELLDTLKKRDEDASKRETERRDLDYAASLKKAREQFALTDEGFDKMVAHMKATGNYTDPMGAAAFIVSQTPPALPPGPLYGSGYVNFAGSAEVSDNKRYKLLHSGQDGPAKYLEAEIRDAFGPNAKDYVAREMGKTYAELAFAS